MQPSRRRVPFAQRPRPANRAVLPRLARALLLPALLGGLAGCGLFGGSEEEAAVPPAVEAARRAEPVDSVSRIEIGRTRDGYLLSAFGVAPGTGFGGPRLVARRDGGTGPDGYLDFDFLAVPPDQGFAMPQGDQRARTIRADLALRQRQIEGAAGIRVHAFRNRAELRF